MSTFDSMSAADYAACVDAGRAPAYDPREAADLHRKEQRENGIAPRAKQVGVHICPSCGSPDVREVVRHGARRQEQQVTHVDLRCIDCDYVEMDDEGGV